MCRDDNPPDKCKIDLTRTVNRQGKVYMTDVSKLATKSIESHKSLIDKVVHWIKEKRKCKSVIYSDILPAHRLPSPNGLTDYIVLMLRDHHIKNGLLALEARTTAPYSTSIQFKPKPPVVENESTSKGSTIQKES